MSLSSQQRSNLSLDTEKTYDDIHFHESWPVGAINVGPLNHWTVFTYSEACPGKRSVSWCLQKPFSSAEHKVASMLRVQHPRRALPEPLRHQRRTNYFWYIQRRFSVKWSLRETHSRRLLPGVFEGEALVVLVLFWAGCLGGRLLCWVASTASGEGVEASTSTSGVRLLDRRQGEARSPGVSSSSSTSVLSV